VTVTPPIVTCALTLAVMTPGVNLLIVIEHVATLPLMVGEPQVSDSESGDPITEGEIVPKLTGVALPGIAVTVTLKVCEVPTSFTPFGAIATLASTKFFVAGPLPPGPALPSVARVTCTPPIVTTPVAFTVKVCTVLFWMVTVQVSIVPVGSTVGALQVLVFVVSGVGVTVGVIELNTVGVADPGNAVKVIVNVCGTFTSFVADGGVITMNASTKRFVAGPLPPGPEIPDVERVTVAVAGFAPGSLSANDHVALALAVNVPTDELLIVIVQVATLPLTVGELHVFV